ncbi:MAG: radical SAM protein [Deltaproteobacteria bacterium]|nr:radical SAM protein [Deltaproteobacteria bacterium]
MEAVSKEMRIESPRYAKVSHASAMSLGLMEGRMYRGAVNRCVNLLVHYPEGCSANCAYCGLAKKRPGTYEEKSFINVGWPVYSMDRIIEAINQAPAYVKRTCISMITNGKCRKHTLEMTRRLKDETRIPISILISPTLLREEDLVAMKEAGADKIGIAIDLATPELFERYRGKGVSGPHKWERYWEILELGLKIFGHPHVGAHLMVGMDETEKEMVAIMDRLWRMGVYNHLFAFFAEKGSAMAERPQPPWPTYLRVQLARFLIEEESVQMKDMAFDAEGHIIDFGLDPLRLREIIDRGTPFMTTGCLGEDGKVACNRPFGNCLPDVKQWNYPYEPNEEELALIREHIFRVS